ncbi:methyl-accepting chemotaxis protein [Desulfosediminicola ganghwensis]|uniref:methyl-accepting chemotaxis protein n=1 Tax=Desulfosediminicola ganghwensis TaxID=2569540 RepID=UPI0010ACC1C5|nr:HAMP domain-containing methyl-accepting chemotaxis protein [Desulfosediminicola ganghwensis]
MESKSKGAEAKSTLFSRLASSFSIRSKLMLAFFVMILLTLSVSAITLVSQTIANKTIDDLVNIHGTIARLSLETEKHLRMMQSYEKDFLIKYKSIGIQEAKDTYLSPFTDHGGQSYQTIYQIQQLATSQADIDTAQTAMQSINEYLSAFIGTVNILELRADPEFGELIKLEESAAALHATVETLDSMALSNAYFQLQNTLKDYLMTPTRDVAVGVIFERDNFLETISSLPFSDHEQGRLIQKTEEFTKWFTEVANTDEVITARIETYEKAAQNAEPIIASFLKNAVRNEASARTQMEESTKLTQQLVIAVGGIAIMIGIFIAIRLSRGLTSQISHIVALFEQIGKGNYDARTEVVSNDELGSMATTLNAMLDNVTVLIQSQTERDAIQNSIMKLLEEISSLTEGDLTARAEVTEDMTGAIADSFNAMTDQLSDIIRKVKEATESVDDTSEEVSKQTMTLANRNIEQTQKVNQAIEAIEQMANSIKDVSENAQQSANVSEASRLNAREGAEAVQRTNDAMNEIREEINETARSIKRLGESSMEIGNVIQIINDIADRTSILALNASIQAAMAGDAGHGFAVVADEVQRLAESSGNSTKQIEALVKNIQAEIKNVSTRMDESISKVVQGSQLADGAHAKLQEIEQVSNQLADLIESITVAATKQVQVSEEITVTMQEVGEVSTESSRSSQETATSMDILSRTAHDLRASVEMFKVTDTVKAA